MGCAWSGDERPIRCRECRRKAVNNLIIIDDVCEICNHSSRRTHRQQSAFQETSYCVIRTTNTTTSLPTVSRARTPGRALYGEFRCICGRSWNSRLSWTNTYQVCKHCRRQVRPHTQRELRNSDRVKDSNRKEHPMELCQKCKSLGHYCGKRTK